MKKLLPLIFALLINEARAQNDIEYINFTVSKIEDVIQIDFTLNSGSTCYGIQIERSTDSIQFYNIGEIPGSCGSPTEPIRYSFIDKSPAINQTNFYRLNFGGAVHSETISLFYYVVPEKTVQSIPNPSNGIFKLKFNNPLSDKLKIEIRNSLGISVFKEATTEENHDIDLNVLSKGIYQIFIYSENSNTLISKGIAIIL